MKSFPRALMRLTLAQLNLAEVNEIFESSGVNLRIIDQQLGTPTEAN
jgi:hypothetical protein